MTNTHNAPNRRSLATLVGVILFSACAEAPLPPTASSATRWVGPLVKLPTGAQFRTVIYYGPWQCSAQLMTYCQRKCAGSGHVLQGCMWLADVKMDFQGTVVRAGSRFGMTHCCCNYSVLSPTPNDASRRQWDAIRTDFRDDWARRFGAWPTERNGDLFQGHHIRDISHGGNPTDWDNIIPYPRELHEDLQGLYNQCYAGNPPWTRVGTDHPYGE